MEKFWYKIFNLTEFEALGLVSKSYLLDLEALGQKEILATKGNLVSIVYEGIFLPINLEGNNPYSIDDHSVYLDANNDIWLGVPL